MKVIKPPFSSVESVLAHRGARTARQRSPHPSSRPASVRELTTTSADFGAVEVDRAQRIERLKHQIKLGAYRPNLELVAERMLIDLGSSLQ